MPIKKHLAHQSRYFIQALHSFSMPEWFSSRWFRSVLAGLVAVFSFLYVIQMSKASVSGYQIRTLEKKIEQLTREQQKIEVVVMEKNSLSAINKRLENVPMVRAQKVIRLDSAPSMARVEKK
jgi:hypothetical protein